MNDWFFQECIEAEQESLFLSAIDSGEVDIEDRDCIDRTPLMVAIEFRKPALVERLISAGANPNSRSNDGDTCLSRAIQADDLKSLELLLEAGADVELVGSNFSTPLALAAIRGNCAQIEILLSHGANIEARGEMDETPLIEACYCGQAAAVTLLLKRGADRSATDTFGQTAPMIAKERGWPLVAAALSSQRGKE